MTWTYEVVLTIDDPEVQGVPRPPEVPGQPIFNLNEFRPSDMVNSPWRCATCYAGRYKTMCFGQNDGGDRCKFCGKTRDVAGWSFFLPYDKLPPKFQHVVTRRHAPKVVTLLRTKWPQAKVQWEGEGSSKDAPSV